MTFVNKTTMINDELLKVDVNIAILQETRLVNVGTIKENN